MFLAQLSHFGSMSNFTQLRCSGVWDDFRLRRHIETRDSSGRFSGSVALCRRVARGQGALDMFTQSSRPPAALAEVAGSCSEDVAMAPPTSDGLAGALEEAAGSCSDEDEEDRFLWFCLSVFLSVVLVAGVSPA